MNLAEAGTNAPVSPQTMGVFERLLGVFTVPAATMRDIAARPTWLPPMIIAVLVSLGFSLFSQDLILESQRTEVRKHNPEITEQQLAVMEKVTKISTPIMAVVMTPLIYLLISGVLLFTGNVLLGGEAKFKTLFATTSWSGMVSVLSTLINAPVMKARGVLESATSLAFLLPPEDNQTPLYFLLSQIDLFILWWVIVLGFGFAAAYKFATNKSMTVLFLWWAAIAGIGFGLKMMFR
ncbi:MAG: YIP1 family protein [candidate division KSB1 bacterium]|nr:YIP1 family protein [candidate division KSB1 bacterium]